MLKKNKDYIDFESILKDDFYRTLPDSHRKQLVEESKNFNNTLLSKFMFVSLKDTIVDLLTKSNTIEEVNHYKSMIATLEVIKQKVKNISNNIF